MDARHHRVQHASGSRCEPRPILRTGRVARVVVVTDLGGEHRVEERLFKRRPELVGEIRTVEHVARRRRRIVTSVACSERRHEVGVRTAAAGSGAIGGHRFPRCPLRATEPVGGNGADQGQACDHFGSFEQDAHDDAAAHAPTDEMGSVDVEGVEQRVQVVGEVAEPTRRIHRCGLGFAKPAKVRCDAPESVGKGQDRFLPEQRRTHVSVHEHDRFTVVAFVDQHRRAQTRGRHVIDLQPGQQLTHDNLLVADSTSRCDGSYAVSLAAAGHRFGSTGSVH